MPIENFGGKENFFAKGKNSRCKRKMLQEKNKKQQKYTEIIGLYDQNLDNVLCKLYLSVQSNFQNNWEIG